MGERKIPVHSLLDTGNLTSCGAGISESFCLQNGIQFAGMTHRKIGTAHEHGKLTVTGILRNLSVDLGAGAVTIPVCWVIRGLSGQLNLGTRFLQQFGGQLNYVENTLRLKGQRRVPLIQQMAESKSSQQLSELEASSSNINNVVKNDVKNHVVENSVENNVVKNDVNDVVNNPFSSKTVSFQANSNVCKEVKNAKRVANKSFFFPGKTANEKSFESSKFAKKLVKVEQVTDRVSVLNCPSVWLKAQSISVVRAQMANKNDCSVEICPSTFSGDPELRVVPGIYPVQKGSIKLLVENHKQYNFPAMKQTINAHEVACQWISPGSWRRAQEDRQESNQEKVSTLKGAEKTEEEAQPKITLNQLYKDLKIDENTLLKKHPKVKQKLKELIRQYRDVFGTAEEVGHTNLVTCELRLKKGSVPCRQKVRPLNPALEADLRKQLDKWLKLKVVKPSKSPWSSPLVPVKKRDGTVRWACDLRKLNSCLVQDSFPLPRIQQLLERAGGHRVYSSLDAVQAYFTIPLDEESQPLTAFATPWGLYQWCRMPFGLATATQVYSRMIAAALNPLGTSNLGAYLDDIIIFSDSMQAHLSRLADVLEQHRSAGIKVKASKTELFQEQITFLGHRLSKDGLAMVPEYVERIVNWPRPTTIKQLTSLIGMLTYYSSFIQGYSQLMAPLNSQRKEKKINWTAECQRNFELIKQKFQEYPLRSVPDFTSDEPFRITTDWSDQAVGVVLSQVQQGKERMIACGGRKCTPGESRYPSWKGEMAALVYAIRKYHHLLSYRKFEVYTDAAALKHLGTLKQTKGIISRWIEELQGYDFDVYHKPGRQNVVADAISRSSHLPEPTQEEKEESEQYIFKVSQDKLMRLDRKIIKAHQVDDEIMQKVREWVTKNLTPTKEQLQGQCAELWFWAKHRKDISMAEDGVLQIQLPEQDAETMRMKILVPQSLKKRVFEACHEHKTAAHFGVAGTMARIRRNFYFFNLSTEVTNRVKICHDCVAKTKQKSLKETSHYSNQPGFPLQILYLDLVGPLNETNEGFQYILSLEDGFSRFVNLYPLRTKETQEVTRVLVERFISQYGCPRAIYSDNGKEFSSKVFQQMCEALGIDKKNSPPYCPQSNKVERVHRTLNSFLRVTTDNEDRQWNRSLPFFSLAYNSKVHTSTGVTPNLAFLGREASLPIDLMTQLPNQGQTTVHQNIADMIKRSQRMFQHIRNTGQAVQRRNASQYGGKKNPYQEGDHVWYYCPRVVPGKPKKMQNQWLGPWVVLKQISEVLIEITPAGYSGKKYIVHVSRIREYLGEINEEQTRKIPSNLEVDDENDPEGEEVQGAHPSAGVELGIPISSGSGGSEMVDLPEYKKDPVEEKSLPQVVLTPVEDGLMEGNQVEEDSMSQDQSDRSSLETNIHPGDTSMDTPSPNQKRKAEEDVEEGKQPGVVKKKIHRRALRRPHESSDSDSGKGRTAQVLKKSAKLLESSTTSSEEDSSSMEDTVKRLEEQQIVGVRLEPGAQLPAKITGQAAGWDLYANEDQDIGPGQFRVISTGVQLQMPPDLFAKIESRSGLTLRGLQTLAGVIDADYRGTIGVVMRNLFKDKFTVQKGDRIAQLLFLPNLPVQMKVTAKLEETDRGHGGFGSTGL